MLGVNNSIIRTKGSWDSCGQELWWWAYWGSTFVTYPRTVAGCLSRPQTLPSIWNLNISDFNSIQGKTQRSGSGKGSQGLTRWSQCIVPPLLHTYMQFQTLTHTHPATHTYNIIHAYIHIRSIHTSSYIYRHSQTYTLTNRYAHTHTYFILLRQLKIRKLLPKCVRLPLLFWEPSTKVSRLNGDQKALIWNLSIHWLCSWIWSPIILKCWTHHWSKVTKRNLSSENKGIAEEGQRGQL